MGILLVVKMEKLGARKEECLGKTTATKKSTRKKPSPMLLFWLCFVSMIFIILLCPGLDPFNSEIAASGMQDVCQDRVVYMYNLPSDFNVKVLDPVLCDHNLIHWLDLCPRFENQGYGLKLESNESIVQDQLVDVKDIFDSSSWFDTDSYMLEMIFHSRMQTYQCLTDDPSKADAFYVPSYVGLLALPTLYEKTDISLTWEKRKYMGMEIINWLQENGGEAWKRYGARDHFLVLGRTAWDFTMFKEWGTGFLSLPFVSNMTSLIMEREVKWDNQQAIPYPTSFHPESPEVLEQWLDTVKESKRDHLFSFVGAPRPDKNWTVRGLIGSACIDAGESTCKLVNCSIVKCSHDPVSIYKAFLGADFCLQPRGDSSTRRSTFDCLISGAIPVFFHNDTAHNQYTWHLPGDFDSYSVFIPEDDVQSQVVSIQDVLTSYSKERIEEMRRTIISFIPQLLYNQYSKDQWSAGTKDAFQVSIERVTDRIKAAKAEFDMANEQS